MANNRSALKRLEEDSAYSKTAAEVLDWTYYDRLLIDGTTPTLVHRLFVTPLGQAGKTLADTNMVLAGLLPQGQNMKVKAIKFLYVTAAAKATAVVTAFYTMLTRTTLEVIIPGKDSMGTWLLSEVLGVSSLFALTPTAAGDNIPLIQPRFHGIFPLNKAIKIGATQSFEIRITHHVAPAATLDNDRIYIGLNGRLVRMS